MSGQVEGYKVPREDVNAPDLYLPGKKQFKLFSNGFCDVCFIGWCLYGLS